MCKLAYNSIDHQQGSILLFLRSYSLVQIMLSEINILSSFRFFLINIITLSIYAIFNFLCVSSVVFEAENFRLCEVTLLKIEVVAI